MRKYLFFITASFLFVGCIQQNATKEKNRTQKIYTQRIYSSNVKDSFTIKIHLPEGYNDSDRYPVVYLLDGDFYFDMFSVIEDTHAKVGLLTPAILVGICYRDLADMDSLRDRDYTYPVALPEYEMRESGGAERFYSFICKELIPSVDHQYRTDTASRVLYGHSLGGYFCCYALLKSVSESSSSFSRYIAASPSLHYNNYYLLKRYNEAAARTSSHKKIRLFMSFGGSENDDDEPGALSMDQLSKNISRVLLNKQTGYIDHQFTWFSGLDHMDTPIPSFIKGMQYCLSDTAR